MPDISMCPDKECSKRSSCYRYLAKPDSYQTWFSAENNENCGYYWDAKTRDPSSLRTVEEADAQFKTKQGEPNDKT